MTTPAGPDGSPTGTPPRALGPRLFGIPATAAPVVAVIRRGPSGWCHVGRWDTEALRYEPGSWLHGTIRPQRADLSPDGRWLIYFALKGGATWAAGPTYIAVSRLPWLTALVAWSTDGTWTRGLHFAPDRRVWEVTGPPDVGDAAPLRRRYGLAATRTASFAVERRRGWTETEDAPARSADDLWDERRVEQVTMEKPRPGDEGTRLQVRGRTAAFRDMQPRSSPARYRLIAAGVDPSADVAPLDDVQWADWDPHGRLLVATAAGELQVRTGPFDASAVAWRVDLAGLRPTPAAPPPGAHSW